MEIFYQPYGCANFMIGDETLAMCRILRDGFEDQWPEPWLESWPINRPRFVMEVTIFDEDNTSPVITKLLELLKEIKSDLDMEGLTVEGNCKYYNYNSPTLNNLLTQFVNCHPDMVFR